MCEITYQVKSWELYCKKENIDTTSYIKQTSDVTNYNFEKVEEEWYKIISVKDDSITEALIPDYIDDKPIKEIGQVIFQGCKNLKTIIISRQIQKIPNLVINDNNVEEIIVNPNNEIYDSRDNCNAIIEKTGNKLILGCNKTIIPLSCNALNIGAFYNCKNIESINIPSNVLIIGLMAFGNCKNLKNIEIPNNVKLINDYTFINCISLISVKLPSTIKRLCNGMFKGCIRLPKIILPEGITSIGYEAFQNCRSLNEIIIPNKVKKIEDRTFSGCINLVHLSIPNNIETIGDSIIDKCKKLVYNESENVKYLGNENNPCLVACSAKDDGIININKSCKFIIEKAFENSQKIVKVILPQELLSIGNYAFKDCINLKQINIPSFVEKMGKKVFDGDNNLIIECEMPLQKIKSLEEKWDKDWISKAKVIYVKK